MSEAVTQVVEPLEDVMERMDVKTVFGEPFQEGDVTIIPVAEVKVMIGYGFGFGETSGEGTDEELEAEMGAGGGGGAGASGKATPKGYIRITPEGVWFDPIANEAAIPLAGIAMVAWSVFWLMKTIRTIAGIFSKS
jgi:uncharacterized spore protein YtfJ